MRIILGIFLLFFVSTTLRSQDEIRCGHGTSGLTAQQIKEIEDNEIRLQHLIDSKASLRTEETIYKIPVVVHIVYQNYVQYVNYDQVVKQIEVLNKDYRKKNADTSVTPVGFKPYAKDVGIEFQLATRDPEGKPTTGVTYTQTSKTSFNYLAEDVKSTNKGGIDAWNPSAYLNIWVCNLGTGSGSNVLGYVPYPVFPGTSADGVAVSYRAFSTYGNISTTYNLGRTATHEIGHWLNLLHPWGAPTSRGCTSDFVDDTPPQASETSASLNCPSYPYFLPVDTCMKDKSKGRMFCSFLDYTRDACMNMFSVGQAERMIDYLQFKRSSILTSPALASPFKYDLAVVEILYDTVYNCSQSKVAPQVRIKNIGSDTVAGYTVEIVFNGQRESFTWSGRWAPGKDTLWKMNNYVPSTEDGPVEITAKVNIATPQQDQFPENDWQKFTCGSLPLSIYPNPADDRLFVMGTVSQINSIKIYDISGKEMLSFTQQDQMDISSLIEGSYIVVFTTNEGKIRHQLIVVH